MKKITKDQLVRIMTDRNRLTQKDNKEAVNSILEIIPEVLSNGDKVVLSGFGTFETVERQARKGNNPITKEKIDIEAKITPKFKAGKPFRALVNGD